MIGEQTLVDLLSRHVLVDGEEISDVAEQDDSVEIVTNKRRFVIRSEKDEWLVGRDDTVADFHVALRADQNIHGQRQRYGFLTLADDAFDEDEFPSGVVYVNDASSLAAFGRRLLDDLDPLAFAELLVQFHPYSSARRTVLANADDLFRLFQLDEPDVEPLRTEETDDGLTVYFESCALYRPPGSPFVIDLYDWAVDVPADGPVTWDSSMIDEAIPLLGSAVS